MTETQSLLGKLADVVSLGRTDRVTARLKLEAFFNEAERDPFALCTIAHYLADLQDSTEDELEWDLRALAAADVVTDEETVEAGFKAKALMPSLHVNLADDYRRLARFDDAERHLTAARATAGVLGDDAYGDLIRDVLTRVGAAVAARDTSRMETNPSTHAQG